MCQHGIARSGKVVLPEEIVDLRTCTLCAFPCAVRRSRVEDDAFIRIDCRVFQPMLHILTIVAGKDTGCNADLSCMSVDALPDRHAPPQFCFHLIRKEGLLRSRRERQLQCRHSRLCRLTIAMKCRQRLRILRMHLGQLRKRLHCLFRKSQIRIPPLRLYAIDAQQNTPAAARIDDATPSERHIFACVLLRMIGVTQIIIGLREIAPDPLWLLRRLEFRQQNAQIALSLFTCKHSRVTRMHECQQVRGNGIGFGHSAICITQLFMNTANVTSSCTAAKDARRIGIQQHFTRHFVDIMPRNEKHLRTLGIRRRDRRAEISFCLI